ncbi:DEAD/DEAH box helicase [Desulfonatronovibrio magnus]|uniref:DEAD/DEAH box helicase n=1 Tax=Desulfonatronovibrio magnus TaxID=698827 RepID=UPI0005EADC40|nr:SNF2-related protein [Desulfonatronovibrio magnus]
MTFSKKALVDHPRHGRGRVLMDDDESVIVQFDHGIEGCLSNDLTPVKELEESARSRMYDPGVNVVTKILGNCITSVNDAWGVFSRSKINLLPHQLWVCKKVLEAWPTRWMVADDVGLGKTIEAGLILTPLLSSGRVRRLLILTPASLVGQWQERLREMFDIRMSMYSPQSDTDKSDYWNTHDKVIASAHTLRKDRNGRWERLLASKPWDMVMIDEAHHMNVDENHGNTLAYELAHRMQKRSLIQSMVMFTGTPHRGKDYGFLSLLKLLKPDDFDPDEPLEDQVQKLRTVMIRNNKHKVTDMKGQTLFTPVKSVQETYSYSPEESYFYDKMTQFITDGKAYAAGFDQQRQRMAILILITMQKLASSSVAAVRKALSNRLNKLKDSKNKTEQASKYLKKMNELLAEDDAANLDEISKLEEKIIENTSKTIKVNPDEIPALEELLRIAAKIDKETKIQRIMDVIDESLNNRSVLFFTEYKATQALLMSALIARYGEGCVAFINGDGYIEGVKHPSGKVLTFRDTRLNAAKKFNLGKVRFLVSTEAAGEGVDLQESCHTLIHVDLPWNPMRLHQRVGRLSRYGQKYPVDVVSLRNPDTVESRIWECLDHKLDRITLAFQGAMDDPEDMRQLVIGMASPRMITSIFADADESLKGDKLETWFNYRASTFGGEDAVSVVKEIFGNVARFDFGQVAHQIPKVDLPDLMPFFKALFAVFAKRPTVVDEVRLSFKTPKEWLDDFTIAERYNLLFDRSSKGLEDEDLAGIGLKVVDRAVQAARKMTDCLAVVSDIKNPFIVFGISDKITDSDSTVKTTVAGMEHTQDGMWNLLKDWEIIKRLNPIADKPRSQALTDSKITDQDIPALIKEARENLELRVNDLELPYHIPVIESLACLVPDNS